MCPVKKNPSLFVGFFWATLYVPMTVLAGLGIALRTRRFLDVIRGYYSVRSRFRMLLKRYE